MTRIWCQTLLFIVAFGTILWYNINASENKQSGCHCHGHKSVDFARDNRIQKKKEGKNYGKRKCQCKEKLYAWSP